MIHWPWRTVLIGFALLISTATPAHAAIVSELGTNSQGAEVTELQERLADLGVLASSPTGYYGPLTAQAVITFQKKAGLPETGRTTPETRDALNSYAAFSESGETGTVLGTTATQITSFLRLGSRGEQVTLLQDFLAERDFLDHEPTGYYGMLTVAAVRSLQQRYGLESVGFVGPLTRALVNSLMAEGHDEEDEKEEKTERESETEAEEGTAPPAPIVTLTADAYSVSSGESTKIAWSSTHADTCRSSGHRSFSGKESASGSETVRNLTSPVTLTLTCTGAGGTASQSITIAIASAPTPVPTPSPTAPAPTLSFSGSVSSVRSGEAMYVYWSSANASSCTASGHANFTGDTVTSGSRTIADITAPLSLTLSCSGAGGTVSKTVPVSVTNSEPTTPAPSTPPATPAPTVTLTADASSVTSGGSTSVRWSSTNATSCVSSGHRSFSGKESASGSETVRNLTSPVTLTLTCTGAGGTAAKSLTIGVTEAPAAAPTVSFSASKTSIASGESVTLSWSSTGATACTASGRGWNASQPTSGSATITGLTTTQTYSLTCTGGGSTTKSVTVEVATAPTPPAPAPVTSGPAAGRTMVFSEEFDAPNFWEATHRPTGRWRDNYGYGGMGDYKFNDEMQIYAGPYFENHAGDFDDGNHVFSNGVLTLVAKKTTDKEVLAWNQGGYSSGMITTRGLEPWKGGPTNQYSFQYGYIEGRIDPSEEQGSWNAFWLLPAGASGGGWAYAEPDIMEKIGQEPHTWQAQHGAFNGGQYATNVPSTASGFHTYGLDWNAQTMTWYIDGVKTWQINTPSDMKQPMIIIANLAVGGSWAGAPNFGSDGKAEMKIDYIRVYK